MPEGDTIFRAARSLRLWLLDREITAARSQRANVAAERLVGTRVVGVEARGKHLLVRFSSGAVLHTHMRMTGSWHVYTRGERWRRPAWQARVVLEAGGRVAVCFNAPVVELLAAGGEARHGPLAGLGPDVLRSPLDLDEVRRRAAARDPALPVGDLLLEQGVVAGIGNIYRCEALFVQRVNPWTPWSELAPDRLDDLLRAAARLMRGNVGSLTGRETGAGRGHAWVYGRHGRACRRCPATVAVRRSGASGRQLWWCPGCQGDFPG